MTDEVMIKRQADHWLGEFSVMASPCQILIDLVPQTAANELIQLAFQEARRIEQKYSRYRDDNIIARINRSQGEPIPVDDETASLLNFAQLCYEISDGLFDVSSGILGKLWHFKQQTTLPAPGDIQALLSHIGWHRVNWTPPLLTLQPGMQIDLGGIGKEYAVDRVAGLLQANLLKAGLDTAFLVNFGGDLYANKPRENGEDWQVAIEDPNRLGQSSTVISLSLGGLASSGDSQRFIEYKGQRYSHILNPKTGHSITGGPSQITVYAHNCLQAGMLATLALLQGPDAENFLQAQNCQYWINT